MIPPHINPWIVWAAALTVVIVIDAAAGTYQAIAVAHMSTLDEVLQSTACTP